ncbi:hypothetical protein PNOK_0977600 [Pyrrhoderma noxium]|uniref:Uncharacterized protein n=1 Tax=Pyrrhoderma noxium TaxID=2282107 RepID=A0A286U564_9AGAM|nr:hypothetical protein PNOK_0977600 [Pyrrhoderma noxium]
MWSHNDTMPPRVSLPQQPAIQQPEVNVEQAIEQLVNNLQQRNPTLPQNVENAALQHNANQLTSRAPSNNPTNPKPINTPTAPSDQTLNSNSELASTSSTSTISKVKLGRGVYEIMQGFHLLLLPVLEELRHMWHVKLWFFTNKGLEKTRLAKDKTGRYNTLCVTFNFDKQGLVTENEYEATMKSAPKDNTLTPD